MIYVVSGQDAGRYSALMDEVYRLRYRAFAEELGWGDLANAEGLERDQLERPDAVHLICVRRGKVAGYLCMLPTVGLHVDADTSPKARLPRGLDTYELTNYCAAPACREGSCGVCTAGSELIAGFVEWGLACKVNKVIVEFETVWVLRAMQLGFQVKSLRAQTCAGKQQLVATLLEFDEATLEAVRDYRKHWDPVVSFRGEHERKRETTTVWPRTLLTLATQVLLNAFCG
jgi:acyl-homoserine lactone synthase